MNRFVWIAALISIAPLGLASGFQDRGHDDHGDKGKDHGDHQSHSRDKTPPSHGSGHQTTNSHGSQNTNGNGQHTTVQGSGSHGTSGRFGQGTTGTRQSTHTHTHIDLPRPQVQQSARLGPGRYGQSTHALTIGQRPPHFDNPPTIHAAFGGSFRNGYYPYRPGWRDSFFVYPYYAFTYSPNSCVASPWYFYPQMPGYVASARIRFGRFEFDFVDVEPYAWHRSSSYDRGSQNYYLDVSIDNLVRAFNQEDTHAVDSLVPHGYYVNVDLPTGGSYQMSSDDFHDMMLDNVTTTNTQHFSISRVQRFRGGAKVQAVHTFIDPNDQTVRTLQTYILKQDENGYYIASLTVTNEPTAF